MKTPSRSRRSATSTLTVAALVGGLLAAGTVVGAQAAHAAVGAAFDCTTPLVFVSQNLDQTDPLNPEGYKGTQLLEQQFTDAGGQFSVLGANKDNSLKYNSIGFDPIDNYIYGVTADGTVLLKIDAGGGVTKIGLPTFNGASVGTNHGAFDPAGNFYIAGGSIIGEISAADIAAASAAADPTAVIPVTERALDPAEGGSDWTYADGFLWSAGPDGDVWRTNLATGTSTDFPNVVHPITPPTGISAYGAAWTYGNGTLGFDANAGDTGTNNLTIQTVDISNPNNPTFLRQVTGPSSGNNDGTSCSKPSDLAITKTVNGQTGSAANPVSIQPDGAVTWQIQMVNNGPGGASQEFVTDTLPAGVSNVSLSAPNASCTTTTPAAGSTFTCTYGYLPPGNSQTITMTATAPPGLSTEFDNTATVAGNEADPTPGNNSATAFATTPPASLSLVKTGVDSRTGLASGALAGDTINYSFLVTNTGQTAVNGVGVTDNKIGTVSCPAAPANNLAPAGVVTCTASYTVTQADVDAGTIPNSATATGTATGGTTVTANSSFSVTAADPTNAVTLLKTAVDDQTGTATGAVVGNTLSYSFAVTNQSDVSMTSMTFTDSLIGAAAISCPAFPAGGVPPGQAITCTAASSHTVSQADVDAGAVNNTATVTASFARGATASAQSSATVQAVDPVTAVALTKTAVDDRTGTATGAVVGDTISYGFHVTNNANVSLTSVSFTDSLIGGAAISCPAIPAAGLAPGASIDCTATSSYTVAQADVDAGAVNNTATVTAAFVRGATASAQSSATVQAVDPVTAVALTKTAVDDRTGTATGAVVGDTISYGFHVTNNANVSLTSVSFTDSLIGGAAISCPAIPAAGLAPGASIDCTATSSYTVAQADVDAGSINNTATVTAAFVRGATASAQSSATVAAEAAAPSISLVKSAVDTRTGTASDALTGDDIDYSFLVTNTGNVSLTGVSIADVDPNVGAITCPAIPAPGLAPSASTTCRADNPHVVTQEEFDAQASLVNTATATAIPVRGPASVTSAPSTATVTLAAPVTSLALVKSGAVTPVADQDAVAVGDTIQYSYLVTNTGNVTLYDVGIDDPHTGLGTITCPDTSAATGTGVGPNTSITCTTAVDGYTVIQSDIDAGFVYNSATAHGNPPPTVNLPPPTSAPSEVTIDAQAADPSIALVKSATVTPEADQDAANTGDQIGYSFLVTNTGNITETDFAIDDLDADVGSITCPEIPAPGLAPGGSTTCTADAQHTITQAEFDLQLPLTNTATASAQPLRGPAAVPGAGTFALKPLAAPPLPPLPARVVSNQSTAVVALAAAAPGLAIVKTATVTPKADQKHAKVGDHIQYDFVVTNTGNVTMYDITVNDPHKGLGPITCPDTSVTAGGVAPQASVTCTTGPDGYTVTQADVDAGSIGNTATAGGHGPPGLPLPPITSPPSQVTVPADPAHPSLSLVKTAHVTPAADQNQVKVGDTISYTFLVTNTGNVTLTKVGVTDPTGGPVICPSATLAPGQVETCKTKNVHTVTADEVDSGKPVVNTATAHGQPPQGLKTVASASSTASVAVADPPGLSTTGTDTALYLQGGLLVLLFGGLLLAVGFIRRPGRR